MWIKALSPQPDAKLKSDLRSAPMLSEHLFGGLSAETVQKEQSKRRDDGVVKLVTSCSAQQTKSDGSKSKPFRGYKIPKVAKPKDPAK